MNVTIKICYFQVTNDAKLLTAKLPNKIDIKQSGDKDPADHVEEGDGEGGFFIVK